MVFVGYLTTKMFESDFQTENKILLPVPPEILNVVVNVRYFNKFCVNMCYVSLVISNVSDLLCYQP